MKQSIFVEDKGGLQCSQIEVIVVFFYVEEIQMLLEILVVKNLELLVLILILYEIIGYKICFGRVVRLFVYLKGVNFFLEMI